jgi:hypothetical protein
MSEQQQNDFGRGKELLVGSLRTILNLYVNFFIGVSMVGLDLPSLEGDFKMDVEKARGMELNINTLISSIESAQNVAEIQKAFDDFGSIAQLFRD